MKYRDLNGVAEPVSAMVLGGAWLGTDIAEEQAFRLMDVFVEQGGNLVDSAHMYANWVPGGAGKSETTIGKWLKRAGHGRLRVATKGADRGLSRAVIRAQLEESLERLGLGALAFYWLHRDDSAVPVGDVIEWLNELVGEGLFPAFGCSNWTTARIAEAQAYAAARGLRGFSASQIGWSLATPGPAANVPPSQIFMDAQALAYHRRTGLAVAAYSSQAGGFFGDAYVPAGTPAGARPNPNIVRYYGTPENYARQSLCRRLAAEKGCTPNQVALAYLLHQSFPAVVIAGANTPERVRDACGAADVMLTPEETAALETAGRQTAR